MTETPLSSEDNGFCSQCGEANARTAAFCAKCGSPLPWAAPHGISPVETAPVEAAPVEAAPRAPVPPPPPMMAPPPPVAPQAPSAQAQSVAPPQPAPAAPVPEWMPRLWAWLFPRELLTAYKGATPQELLRFYGPRVVGFVLLAVVVKSFAESIFDLLVFGTLVCLVMGIRKPETFRWVFGEKTSKATVGWTFGALLLVLGMIGSSMEAKKEDPAPILAPASRVALVEEKSQPAATSAPVKKTAAQVRAEAANVRAAQVRAKAQQALGEKVAEKKQAERDASAMAQAKSASEAKRNARNAPNAPSQLPSNVAEVDIPGIGKRQAGEVDGVFYTVLRVDRHFFIGDTRADGVFYLLHVVAKNRDKKTHTVATSIMKLLDDQGNEFFPSDTGSMALVMSGDKNAEPFSTQLQPSVTKQFTLVYETSEDARGLQLKIPKGTFSFGKSATLKVPVADE